MRRWISITLCALALFGTLARAGAEERSVSLNDNAALKYWRAFALLPHLSDKEQEKLRSGAQTSPLDARIKELLAKCEPAFHELHHGSRIARCAWSISLEDGIGARLPEIQA